MHILSRSTQVTRGVRGEGATNLTNYLNIFLTLPKGNAVVIPVVRTEGA
jgi:hypothetical protein